MKAVIPAAGLGTRFLPYTKSTPKEMLPVLDKPAIQYVVEEALAADYDQILLVTGRHKRSIEDHFDRSSELEQYLEERNDAVGLEKVRQVSALTNLLFVRQKEPRGLGHAILAGEQYLSGEPFGVLLGDDICVSQEPCQRKVLETFRRLNASTLAVQEVPESRVIQYGVISGPEIEPGVFRIESIQEKPSPRDAKSNLVVVGRYQFTPELLGCLAREARQNPKDVGLTPAIWDLTKREDVYAVKFAGRRYDVGDKGGWLLANLELGLKAPEFRKALLARFPTLRSIEE